MATVINNPSTREGSSDEGMSAGFILGIIVAILVVILAAVYGIPALRQSYAPAVNNPSNTQSQGDKDTSGTGTNQYKLDLKGNVQTPPTTP